MKEETININGWDFMVWGMHERDRVLDNIAFILAHNEIFKAFDDYYVYRTESKIECPRCGEEFSPDRDTKIGLKGVEVHEGCCHFTKDKQILLEL